MVGKPTEEELASRIEAQIGWRGATDNVALIWNGYLAGLYEWQVIDLGVYTRLSKLLPRKGAKELDEIFAGEPITPEREKEIERFSEASKA